MSTVRVPTVGETWSSSLMPNRCVRILGFERDCVHLVHFSRMNRREDRRSLLSLERFLVLYSPSTEPYGE